MSDRGGSDKQIKNSALQEHVAEASLISFAGGSWGGGEDACFRSRGPERISHHRLLLCCPGRANLEVFPVPSPSTTQRTVIRLV